MLDDICEAGDVENELFDDLCTDAIQDGRRAGFITMTAALLLSPGSGYKRLLQIRKDQVRAGSGFVRGWFLVSTTKHMPTQNVKGRNSEEAPQSPGCVCSARAVGDRGSEEERSVFAGRKPQSSPVRDDVCTQFADPSQKDDSRSLLHPVYPCRSLSRSTTASFARGIGGSAAILTKAMSSCPPLVASDAAAASRPFRFWRRSPTLRDCGLWEGTTANETRPSLPRRGALDTAGGKVSYKKSEHADRRTSYALKASRYCCSCCSFCRC